ncbi:MAG: tarJ [Anaerocolumna sp.]|jgi:ribitol-5-phosphate 2-dehydrogenase|nr:tarJ [Anaerocolumna sp.]
MINTIYRLIAPRKFQMEYEDIDILNTEVIVRPTYLSICHADQRYYQGLREPSILQKKLPMALIHEAIGEVVYDKGGSFEIGDRVVMIPNLPPFYDDIVAENYLKGTKFRSSGYDGFLQEYVATETNRVILLPDNINNHVAAFLELISVAIGAINRFDKKAHMRKDNIAVWGDGNLGYITALLLKKIYPAAKVIVFGKNIDKLNDFSFVDETYLINNIPKEVTIDHAFECVGGNSSGAAINQMINLIEPEGAISIMGVSEYEVGVNTRLILEKGIYLIGNSRSSYDDFKQAINILKDNSDVVEYLEKLISSIVEVSNLQQIAEAFEDDIRKKYGKTVLKWNG